MKISWGVKQIKVSDTSPRDHFPWSGRGPGCYMQNLSGFQCAIVAGESLTHAAAALFIFALFTGKAWECYSVDYNLTYVE